MLFTDEIKREIVSRLEADYNTIMADYDEDTPCDDGSVAWFLKTYPQHKDLIHAVELNYIVANLHRALAQLQKARLKKTIEALYSENPTEEEIKKAKYQLLSIQVQNDYIEAPSIDIELADWYYNTPNESSDEKYNEYVESIMGMLSKNIHEKPNLDEILSMEDTLDFERKEGKSC